MKEKVKENLMPMSSPHRTRTSRPNSLHILHVPTMEGNILHISSTQGKLVVVVCKRCNGQTILLGVGPWNWGSGHHDSLWTV